MESLASPAAAARWEDVERDRVSAHFEWVLVLLRAQDVRDWSADRKERRAFTLDALEVYARRGQFPRNPLKHRMAPAFVDHRGTECAVASLMLAHGLASTVEQVRLTMNLAYVADMGEAVDDFAETSGLTREELALVQPDYCPDSSSACFSIAQACDGPDSSSCHCVVENAEPGTPCDVDANPCTVEACQGGSCVFEGPLDCDDRDPTTHDVCAPARGCVSVPIALPDGEGSGGAAPAPEPEPTEPEPVPESDSTTELEASGGCAFGESPPDAGTPAPVLAALFLLTVARMRPAGRRG